jgi:ABC-2 type transport system ATP-binding protein
VTEQGAPITLEAERVRKAIRGDLANAFGAVVDFANTHAVTAELRHEALLLKFAQREATPEELPELGAELLDLVKRVEVDHEARWDDSAAAARREQLSEVHARYLARPELVEPAFIGQKLGKSYAGFRLQGVDLVLSPGEVAGVVGQNANGKTTLLRIVAGELRPDEGTLKYPLLSTDKRLNWAEVKAHIAYLPQVLPAWSGSLLDNLHYEAALHGLRGEENEREVDFFVERLGLREHLDKRWSQLSGGYMLRFALARVLVWKPRLLVLDEPLANLDVLAQNRLLQDLVDLARSPRYPLAILLSSQHLHELEAVASSITFLRNGNVEFGGRMSEIGSDRSYNVYELGTPRSSEATLRELFSDPRFGEPMHNGVSYVIKTSRELAAPAVLHRLLDAGIEVSYFRDISRSIKRLFE